MPRADVGSPCRKPREIAQRMTALMGPRNFHKLLAFDSMGRKSSQAREGVGAKAGAPLSRRLTVGPGLFMQGNDSLDGLCGGESLPSAPAGGGGLAELHGAASPSA